MARQPKSRAPEVVRTEVPEERRLAFLPTHVQHYHTKFEALAYDTLSNFSEDYTGGYWQFYSLSNGGWYIAPHLDIKELRFEIESNGWFGELSPDAAGIVVSLCCINWLLWSLHEHGARETESLQRYLRESYYRLRDYALQHPEAGEILAAID